MRPDEVIVPHAEGISADSHTLREHRVPTADGAHVLYVQEWGTASGTPVVFLHGGPGTGCDDAHKRYFDPGRHRVVFPDQRGSGRSTPHGSLERNDTQALIDDLEQVRILLQLPSWHVTGGSWGSTLALCYALAHPLCVASLVLRGVFLGTRVEIDWIEQGGYRRFYPEVWDRAGAILAGGATPDPAGAYAEIGAALGALAADEAAPSSLSAEERESVAIELHYNAHSCFLPDGHIMQSAATIEVPTHIVQGRYDMITPPVTAYRLHQAIPHSTYRYTVAGHSGSDAENLAAIRALVRNLSMQQPDAEVTNR